MLPLLIYVGVVCAIATKDSVKFEELGPCVNSLCPESYQCIDNACLRPIPRVRAHSKPIGPCVNDECPNRHFCVKDDYKCYPIDE
ncbi:hypothetical protein KIN20_017618 [Parelaphostrongylus tenuis]|uniref:Uncharacterized protein n=1 Tax=Parelaphostrongylus tenuis TaxID=148309 RepID=A0AAD5QNR7_PARTN|nr:hypothetical protein KIN20_017618 [Parelaphostrongylus tenuis]